MEDSVSPCDATHCLYICNQRLSETLKFNICIYYKYVFVACLVHSLCSQRQLSLCKLGRERERGKNQSSYNEF